MTEFLFMEEAVVRRWGEQSKMSCFHTTIVSFNFSCIINYCFVGAANIRMLQHLMAIRVYCIVTTPGYLGRVPVPYYLLEVVLL